MHLAIVGPYPPYINGISQYGYYVSQALAASEQFSRITVLADQPLLQTTDDIPTIIHVEEAWQSNSTKVGWSIVKRLRDLKPDLVWFNLDVSSFGRSALANVSGFLSPYLTRRLGFPTVVTLHELIELADLKALKAPGGPFAPLGARMLTYIATRADVICLTMRRYAEWLSVRQPDSQCIHIPIGAYRRPNLLSESQSAELLLFGVMAPYKGLEILLDAFVMLRQSKYPQLQLTIAGATHPRFPRYAQQWKETTQNIDGIRWLGKIPEENIRSVFERAQIVVLPYTTSTGASSVLYQAVTWGRAVVASDLPETQSLVRESGLDVTFFQTRNATGLAEQLDALLSSPETRRRQVQNNLLAMQHHQPEDICRAYLRAFNIALEARRSPKRFNIPVLESA